MTVSASNRFAGLRNMKIGPQPAQPPAPTDTGTVPGGSASAPVPLDPTPQPPVTGRQRQRRDVPADKVPKRIDPNYQQVNTYIPIGLHQLVWRELVSQRPRGQFDSLIEDLLRTWLRGKGITTDLDGKPL